MTQTAPERVLPETLDEANEWIVSLQDALHREREYAKKLAHDLSTLREAVWTVLCQTQLYKTTMRRILRLALQACKFDGYDDICKQHGLRSFNYAGSLDGPLGSRKE